MLLIFLSMVNVTHVAVKKIIYNPSHPFLYGKIINNTKKRERIAEQWETNEAE